MLSYRDGRLNSHLFTAKPGHYIRCQTIGRATYTPLAAAPRIENATIKRKQVQTFRFATFGFLLFSLQLCCFSALSRAVETASHEEVTDLGTRGFGEDWPIFLGPTGDSKSTETGILKDWSTGLKPQWSLALTSGYGTCTISRGRTLQFDAQRISRDSNRGILHCVHSETGEAIWTYEYEYQYRDQYGYNNGPRTSPIIDGNRVYLFGVDGSLRCVRLDDGKESWHVDTSTKYGVIQNFFGVGSNPVIVGENVLTMIGGSPKKTSIQRATGNGTGIVAFNKYTGEEAFRLSDELASYASLKVAEYQGRLWCFAFTRGGLLAFNPTTGKQDFFFPWRAKIVESVNASVPIVFGSQVFISETYGPGSALLDFNQLSNGEPAVVWSDLNRRRRQSMQTHWNTPIFHEGYIYGSSGRHSNNAELRCINAKTGQLMWKKPGLSRASLLFVEDHFICLDELGGLRLIRALPTAYSEITATQLLADSGTPLLREPAWAAPVLSHGLLYLRGKDRLVCVDVISNGVAR